MPLLDVTVGVLVTRMVQGRVSLAGDLCAG